MKKGSLSIVFFLPTFLIMLMPACKAKADYGTIKGSGTGFSFNGTVGNIYQFIFGSSGIGKYGLESTKFNVPMFLGFLSILASIVLWLIFILQRESSFKLKLAETITSGVATFFLSPIFSLLAVYSFYNSLDYYRKNGTYAEYKDFRYGFGFVLLFLVLAGAVAYNLVSAIQIKRKNIDREENK